jgi:uncharacterized protein (TIGR02145 family)
MSSGSFWGQCFDNSFEAGPPLDYEGQTYKTVRLGCQTWMAENLNYNVSGSKCYGDNTGGDSQGNCAKYGRLYDWTTAMGISSYYKNEVYEHNPSPTKINKGICPIGWHIPSNWDWDQLYRFVDYKVTALFDISRLYIYESNSAGKYLKAQDGWYGCGPVGTGKVNLCMDTYGFTALPGGYGEGGDFSVAGSMGCWWSTTEGGSGSNSMKYYAYFRNMVHQASYAVFGNESKELLFSVRCIQD